MDDAWRAEEMRRQALEQDRRRQDDAAAANHEVWKTWNDPTFGLYARFRREDEARDRAAAELNAFQLPVPEQATPEQAPYPPDDPSHDAEPYVPDPPGAGPPAADRELTGIRGTLPEPGVTDDEIDQALTGDPTPGRYFRMEAQRDTSETAPVGVLGHFPDYSQFGGAGNAHVFQIPTEQWDRMSADERWAENRRFLDELVERQDRIVLTQHVDEIRHDSFLRDELDHLRKRGYRPSADGLEMVRGDGGE